MFLSVKAEAGESLTDVWTLPEPLTAGPEGRRDAASCPEETKTLRLKQNNIIIAWEREAQRNTFILLIIQLRQH